jgi:hypothetical protein
MPQPLSCGSSGGRGRQRGQALLIFLAIIATGVIAVLYTSVRPASLTIEREKATAATLAQVKEALIGWSVSRDPSLHGANARPGELPCPDMNNDGFDDGSCVAGALGRVPWKTLGIPEPKDTAGETLWYAVAGPFRIWNMSSAAITSDTIGNITVYQDSTATLVTAQAVTVIFSPGAALGPQDRDSAVSALCSTTGTNIARNLCAENYLETAAGTNNAVTNGPFISSLSSQTFNDKVMAITNFDLIPLVERRVAREMMSRLENYRIATGGLYPSADRGNGSSDLEYNRHRFPCATAIPVNWVPSLPNWLTNGCGTNGWASVIFYAVSKDRLQGGNCLTCSGGTPCGSTTTTDTRLTITNASNRVADSCPAGVSPYTCTPAVLGTGIANLLLITPGPATTNRASGWPSSLGLITGYFEDALNSDNDDGNCYVVPTSTSHDRDRMYVSIP